MDNCPEYKGIHIIQSLTIDEIQHLISIIKIVPCNILFKNIVCNIGSPSENAIIYKALYNNLPVAIKIPRENSNDNIDNEIKINIFLKKYNDFFLQMYDFKECPIYGKVIFNELAIGDLLQILSVKISFDEINKYIVNVFDSVYILASLGIRHNDLHIKNIFIIKRENNTVAVLGDFGKSIEPKFLVSNTDDIYKFFSSLKKYLSELYYPGYIIDLITKYIRKILFPIRNKYEYVENWNRLDDQNLIKELYEKWILLINE